MNPITREESLLDGQDLTPITRKEQFIKRIYDKTQEVPIPVTREEWFLKKAGEGTSPVTIEQLSVTENGTYSEPGKAYSPVIVEVPEPTLITKSITENGTYTASEDNADGYSQATVAVEGFKKKSIANTPTDIASFDDGTANPMPSLEISIEPQQDLHGYDNPWVGGAGKNKCDLSTLTHTGVSNDTGTESTLSYRLFSTHISVKSDTTYTLSLTGSKNGENIYVNRIIYFDSNNAFIERKIIGYSQAESFTTLSNAKYIQIDLKTASNYDIEIADISKIQLEEGSTATTYEPYSNICPISGHTEADVTVTDDLTTPTETHTLSIPFHDSSDNPIAVYGGRLNVTSGELIVDRAYKDLGTLSWVYYTSTSPLTPYFYADVSSLNIKYEGIFSTTAYQLLCSQYESVARDTALLVNGKMCADGSSSTQRVTQVQIKDSRFTDATSFKTAINGVQLVYELATPQTYQLTPAQVSTLLGQNNIFADCGQILEGEYFVTL